MVEWRGVKATIILSLTLLSLFTTHPQVLSTASPDNGYDQLNEPCLWTKNTWGGAQITMNKNITITSSPAHDVSGSQETSTWKFTADFDVQVEYVGDGWGGEYSSNKDNPHLDAAGMGIEMEGSTWSINLSIKPWNGYKQYALRLDHVPAGGEWTMLNYAEEAPSASGGFRIVRAGTNVEFRYYTGSQWGVFYTQKGIDKPVSLFLTATSVFTNHTFSTVFKNLIVNSGKTDYIPLIWKDTFPNRGDLMVGGLATEYIAQKFWGSLWKDTNPWTALKENGGEWARVWLTNIQSKQLSETPVSKWNTLDWSDDFWCCREYSEECLREARDAGLRLDLIFFFGDKDNSWGVQDAPAAWRGLSVAETAAAMENFTYSTAKYYQSKGLNIEMYEMGDEIDQGLCDFLVGDRVPAYNGSVTYIEYMRSTVWKIEAQLLNGAIAGVHRANPDAEIVLHTAGLGYGTSAEEVELEFFRSMVDEGVDFDYAGITHPYPDPCSAHPDAAPWLPSQCANHMWFQHMNQTISPIARLGKKVMISEAIYPNSREGIYCDPMPDYPSFTPESQAAWLRDQLLFASNNENVAGWFYYDIDHQPGMSYNPAALWSDTFGIVRDDGPLPAIREFLMGRSPANLELVDLKVKPTQSEAGKPLNISVKVRNTGDIEGTKTLDLKVNGVTKASKKVTVEGGAETTVSFTISEGNPGSYSLTVGSLSGGFTITTMGSIKVTVMDVAGNPASGVSVSSKAQPTGQTPLAGTTDATGVVIFSGVVPGSYTFGGSAKGYVDSTASCTVAGGASAEAKIVLQASTPQSTGGGGVPGYPYGSALLGIAVCVVGLAVLRRRARTSS